MKKFYLFLFISFKVWAQIPFVSAPKYLDKNYVKARIMTVNNKFWNISGNGNMSYEVPKGKGTHAQFANSVWIGGYDAGGQLHISANTYRQSGTDFWPGPLDTSNIAAFNLTNTAVYNKLWKVDCDDITNFVNAFNSGSVTAGTYTVPPDILSYPAQGIGNFQKKLQPYADANNNGQYNPQAEGDFPLIKGQQQILSIYNDNYASHGETQAPAMGLEIHERSYVYFQPNVHDSMQALNYTTFYHYTIFNRSNTSYNQVYISDWSDVDLGYYLDDYIGTDTLLNFAYCYNGKNNDSTAFGIKGYGNKPPVISHAILKTNCSNDGIDNNANGNIDEPGESFVLNKSTYYNNNINTFPPPTINPSTAQHFYNYMRGFWKDNSPFTFGGTAYGGSRPTDYVYTGDPSNNTGWTEATAGNAWGDRRIVISSGPFNFPAHSKIEWGYALVFSQDTTQAINTITQFHSRVQRDVKNVLYYDQTHQSPFCAPQITNLTALSSSTNKELSYMLYPNPTKNLFTIDLNANVNEAQVKVFDLSGRLLIEKTIEHSYHTQLDVTALESGVYFVQLQSGHQLLTQKLVKE